MRRSPDLLQAPILFFNGHRVPDSTAAARTVIREYVEQGGFLFADACCGSKEFDQGFRTLMKEIFPEEEYQLRPLPPEHPIWRARHLLIPEIHPLWGIEHGCRTVVIYSPTDLSCYWNQMEHSPNNPAVDQRDQGRPERDRLRHRPRDARRQAGRPRGHGPQEGRAQARAPCGSPSSCTPATGTSRRRPSPTSWTSLRKPPFSYDVVLTQKDLFPRDPNLIYYPLIYIHGRGALSFPKEDLEALRRHLEPGGGTLFADAACGSPAFDAAFRRFVAELVPDNKLEPIPRDDELYTNKVGFDLRELPVHQGGRRRQGLPAARGRQAQRPLGDHLLEVRPRLCAGAPLGDRLQGVHATRAP